MKPKVKERFEAEVIEVHHVRKMYVIEADSEAEAHKLAAAADGVVGEKIIQSEWLDHVIVTQVQPF